PRAAGRDPLRREGVPEQDQAARGLLERLRVRRSRCSGAGGSTFVGVPVDLLLPAERHRRIQEFLQEHRAARVSTLAEQLGVSEVTVRRDLEDLERRGLLERTHGGAIVAERLARESLYVEAASLH